MCDSDIYSGPRPMPCYYFPNLFFNARWLLLLFLNLCFFILSLLFLNTESMYMVLSTSSSQRLSSWVLFSMILTGTSVIWPWIRLNVWSNRIVVGVGLLNVLGNRKFGSVAQIRGCTTAGLATCESALTPIESLSRLGLNIWLVQFFPVIFWRIWPYQMHDQ